MNTSNNSALRMRPLFKRLAALALVVGVAVTVGVTAIAHTAGGGGWHHGRAMTAADMDAHVDAMLQHIYAEIDVTDAQKAQIDPLVKQAMSDLMPLHTQAQSAHTQFIQALTQPTLDRNSLEAAREAHMQLAEEASKRFVQLIGDVGNILTPAQRQALANHIQKLHGMPGS